jgi:hypothetical protein
MLAHGHRGSAFFVRHRGHVLGYIFGYDFSAVTRHRISPAFWIAKLCVLDAEFRGVCHALLPRFFCRVLEYSLRIVALFSESVHAVLAHHRMIQTAAVFVVYHICMSLIALPNQSLEATGVGVFFLFVKILVCGSHQSPVLQLFR